MSKILIVDDEPGMGSLLSDILHEHRHDTKVVRTPAAARVAAAAGSFDLALVDIELSAGQTDGLELLREFKQQHRDLPVIILTGHGSKERAVMALRMGAQDFIEKPFSVDELIKRVGNALLVETGIEALKENVILKEQLQGGAHFANFIGDHPSMRAVYRLIERVATNDVTVLILGESGTGKELVARALHSYSRRAAQPFIVVNCAALPEHLLESELFGHRKGAFTGAAFDKVGLFQAADRGTIFLDEVGAMPLPLQSKLLRFLQDRELRRVGDNDMIQVDVRVVAATNEPLEQRVATQLFREDLYYRLSVIPVTLPPLRERATDIPLLAAHFLRGIAFRQQARQPNLAPEVLPFLTGYRWPGNVRELQNVIERACVLCDDDVIQCRDLPPHLFGPVAPLPAPMLPIHPGLLADLEPCETPPVPLKEWVRRKEAAYIERVLGQTAGNRQKAARMLGVSRVTISRKLHLPEEPEPAGLTEHPVGD